MKWGTRQMSSGKRNVHHTIASTSVEEEDDKSDDESDYESSDDEKSHNQVSRVSVLQLLIIKYILNIFREFILKLKLSYKRDSIIVYGSVIIFI